MTLYSGLMSQLNATFRCTVRGAGPELICDRQPAAPVRRRDRAAQRREQRLRITVRDRQHRNLRERRRVLDAPAASRPAVAPTPGVSGSPG